MSFNLAAALPQTTLWAMFVGGLVAFLSPCVLPMLPVYGLYLVGEGSDTADRRGAWVGVLKRSLGLLAGFVTLFTLMGAGAGLVGGALKTLDRGVLNLATAALMILFGLWTADFIHWKGLNAPAWATKASLKPTGFFSAALFGIVIALSWTPCLTPVLANALILATSAETVGVGMASLAMFALGLALPMLVFMALYQTLKDAFTWLRNHQPLLRRIGGLLMIAYGLWLLLSTLL
ncbi:MAG: cytochrome c biogenesis CcdA family protein [Candidatus Limiplasma sp.]|nr:cytochrome c biogenesis CcdA family protein [Candidatus Limiplasma sp.]